MRNRFPGQPGDNRFNPGTIKAATFGAEYLENEKLDVRVALTRIMNWIGQVGNLFLEKAHEECKENRIYVGGNFDRRGHPRHLGGHRHSTVHVSK